MPCVCGHEPMGAADWGSTEMDGEQFDVLAASLDAPDEAPRLDVSLALKFIPTSDSMEC